MIINWIIYIFLLSDLQFFWRGVVIKSESVLLFLLASALQFPVTGPLEKKTKF